MVPHQETVQVLQVALVQRPREVSGGPVLRLLPAVRGAP